MRAINLDHDPSSPINYSKYSASVHQTTFFGGLVYVTIVTLWCAIFDKKHLFPSTIVGTSIYIHRTCIITTS